MKIQRTNINEGVDDNKLTPQDKQVVKKVLDITGGDMVAAAAVGQAKIAQKDKVPGNEQLKEGQEAKEISADVCRSNGYMIGKIPYVCIQEDALQILDYVRAPYNFAKLIKKGQFYIDFEDICDGVYERLNYEGAKASDAAYSLKKFFEDNGVPVEDTPEEGSRAAEYEDEPEEQLPRSRKRKPFFSLDNESLEEDLYDSDEDVEFQNEVDSIIDAESENQSSSNCINDSATAVMESYQNANKWLDIVKEYLFTELGSVFFSSYIHNLAHTMPVRFDKFGDILHTIDMLIPYPATEYIPQYPTSIDDTFDIVFSILDSIKDSLNNFIKCTDEEYHGMACSAETLLNDIEGEYVPLFKMRKAWEDYQDVMRFDKWVGQYVEKRDSLSESLEEGKIGDFFKDRVDDVKSAMGKRYVVQSHDRKEDKFQKDGTQTHNNSNDEFKSFKHRTDAEKYIKNQQKNDGIEGNAKQYTNHGSLNRKEAAKRLDVARYNQANQKVNDAEQKAVSKRTGIGTQATDKFTNNRTSTAQSDKVNAIKQQFNDQRSQIQSDKDLELSRMGYKKGRNEDLEESAFPTLDLQRYIVICANKDQHDVYANSEKDAWDEAESKYQDVENVYLDEALYEEANDTTSCKMEMCKDLTDADEYVVDSALSELGECRNCDQQEVSSVIMDLCKNIDASEFDNDPDFDRCVDFVTTLLSEGYRK